jgi:predicted metal-binding membrane protein
MSVLLVVGLMKLVWMAALSLVFLAEKNWRRGPLLSKLAGSLVALLGAAVILHPALLSSLAG